MTTSIALGIDFGDQFCKVATADAATKKCLNELDILFLSPVLHALLAIDDEKDTKSSDNTYNISSLKHLLGCAGEEADNNNSAGPFVLGKTDTGEVGVEFQFADGKRIVPSIEVIAIFLCRVITLASSLAQGTVTQAVITVPGWFSQANLRSMASAIKMSGLKIFEIIPEATAAQMDYVVTHLKAISNETKSNIVFIDIGHTATSLSVLSVLDGKPAMKNALSDPTFGGRNVDIAIRDFLFKGISDDNKKVLADCQRVKEALHLFDDMDESLEISTSASNQASLSGHALYKLVASLHHIPDLVKVVLKGADLPADQVHKVVLTGGSMRLLQVRDCISSLFPTGVIQTGSHMTGAKGALYAGLSRNKPGHLPDSTILSGLLPSVISTDVPTARLKPLSLQQFPSLDASQYSLLKDIAQVVNPHSIHSAEIAVNEPLKSQARLVKMTPDGHIYASTYLDKYASLLDKAFDTSENRIDLLQAILIQTKAADVSRSPTETPEYLNNLAKLFNKHYKLSNELNSLNMAIASLRKAQNLAENDSPFRFKYSSNLSILCHAKYDRTKDPKDLDHSIQARKATISLLNEGDAIEGGPQLNLYSLLLERRFDQQGNIVDLTDGIAALDRAVNLPLEADSKNRCHFNLGVLLKKLYDRNGELADLDRSIDHQRKAISWTPEGSEKAMYLEHLGESLQALFIKRWNLDDLNSSIKCHQNAADMTEEKHPSKVVYLNSLGKSLGLYFTHQQSASHLNDGITAQRSAVDLTGDRQPNKGLYLRNLAMLLERRYAHALDIHDLDEAIACRNTALSMRPLPRAEHLTALVESLYDRYRVVPDPSDLETAIIHSRKVVDMTPDFMPTKVGLLEKLAAYLSKYHREHDNLSYLEEAVVVQQQIVDLAEEDTSETHRHLFHLGSLHRSLYDRLGKESDLRKAVSLLERAVESSEGKPEKANYLNHLGSALHEQFLLSADITQLDAAILYLRKATTAAATEEDKISYVNNLAIFLLDQFKTSGDARYLHDAVQSYQTVVDLTPPNHPSRTPRLNNLGVAIKTKFEFSGQIDDLNKSIEILEAAASSSTINGTSKRLTYAGSLGSALMMRFEHSGAIEDIDNAIAHHQRALDALPDGDPEKAGHYSLLGGSLQNRFDSYGELHDLNRAVKNQQSAVDATPDGHVHLPLLLNSLSNCLRKRLLKQGNLEDLIQAISYQERAVNLTPKTHIHRAIYLCNLGISMTVYFNLTGNLSYLDTSIAHHEMVLSLTPDGLPPKPDYLMELGEALQKRGQAAGRISDLDKAVQHLERAIKLTPQVQPTKARQYYVLGQAFRAKFKLENKREDLRRAIQVYIQGTQHESGTYNHRFYGALAWIECAELDSDPSLKLAYSTALEILPNLAWVGLSVETQINGSLVARNIGCDAAAAAIRFVGQGDEPKSLDLAIEWLEQGRSILWNQILQLRSPLNKFKDIDVTLAEKIQRVSMELDQHRALGSDLYISGRSWSDAVAEHHLNRQHYLATQLDLLMKQARNTPRIQNYFNTPIASDLKQSAAAGLVVVLNMAGLQTDALIIRSPDLPVLRLPLEDFPRQDAENLRNELSNLVHRPSGLREAADRHGGPVNQRTQTPDDSFRYILRELWLKVVKPIITLLQLSVENDVSKLPHIYWCPTGPLTFLPLHAAGLYGSSVHTETLAQYAVSSYIPNLGTLCTISNKLKQHAEPKQIRMLAVVQPATPGQHKLPATLKELEIITRHVSGHHLSVLNGPQATREVVMTGLDDHSWIHLSCHGIQNLANAAHSGLALHDGMLSLLDLIKKPLPRAEFAFLAACQTATGDSLQVDEAIHLAGGFLLAGFSSVIATMWSVMDDDGPEVADKVYDYLFRAEEPDISQTAYALHSAVQHLRLKYHDTHFAAWVPYIHMGL